jgi:hypothetical protein
MIGVYIFSFTPGSPTVPAVAKVHHHWVTEAGDTTATAYQVGPFAGVYAVADDSYIVISLENWTLRWGIGKIESNWRAGNKPTRPNPMEGYPPVSGNNLFCITRLTKAQSDFISASPSRGCD